MTDLQKEFESNGYTSWINADLYPDGKIYTQEYTQWLERQVLALRQFSVANSNKSIANSKMGDFVICKYVNGSNQKCLTEGKTYEIIDFDFDYMLKMKTCFYIIDDNGKKKKYDVFSIQFSGIISANDLAVATARIINDK